MTHEEPPSYSTAQRTRPGSTPSFESIDLRHARDTIGPSASSQIQPSVIPRSTIPINSEQVIRSSSPRVVTGVNPSNPPNNTQAPTTTNVIVPSWSISQPPPYAVELTGPNAVTYIPAYRTAAPPPGAPVIPSLTPVQNRHLPSRRNYEEEIRELRVVMNDESSPEVARYNRQKILFFLGFLFFPLWFIATCIPVRKHELAWRRFNIFFSVVVLFVIVILPPIIWGLTKNRSNLDDQD
eukprot:TRINITY_DN1792_c0_g1_i1.p1 TRINITY_DN1792_c0_g1~~TRINITY_DN1792_c0_g1_i1.p1  ORF type:complete len:238 (-),score=32.17 TRINITY_DN1792_c0_g1_i1:154-867(-)